MLIVLLALAAGCGPVRRQDFLADTPRPKLGSSDVVLDLGRRYGVVASGIGVVARTAPDPAAQSLMTVKFATIVATTGEASGADGKVWRRIENGGWAPREGVLVFNSLREALNLVIELRVFSGPDLRRPNLPTPVPARPSPSAVRSATPAGPATPSPSPTATRTATPSPSPSPSPRPRPSPTRSAFAVPEPLYAVVIRPGAREFDRPGADPSDRPSLEIGNAVAVVDQAVGSDGQRYYRTDENSWVAADAVATYASLPEATDAAYRATMQALAPGVEVDPRVMPALWLLHREPEFRYLADAIRDKRVPIRVGQLGDPSLIASYSFADRSITVADRYADGDVRILAVALAHEATHAWEHGQGLVLNSTAGCFEAELRAFRNQAALWEKFYGPKGKESTVSQAEVEQNDVLRLIKENPEQLKARLVARYGDQCGYHGPLPDVGTGAPTRGTPGPGMSSGTASPSSAGPASVASPRPVAATPVPGAYGPAGAPSPAPAKPVAPTARPSVATP